MAPRTVLVTGANGYIGNAVARSFVRAGWVTYGLVRSEASAGPLALEEILPVVGSIDDTNSHERIRSKLPPALNAIISTTENITDYVPHYTNVIRFLRTVAAGSKANGVRSTVIFTSGCKDYGIGPHYDGTHDLAPHTEKSEVKPAAFALDRATYSLKIFDHGDLFLPVLVRPTNVYGRASSAYKFFFDIGEKAAASDKPFLIPSVPNAIVHALHVDDCGDAYVAIASHPHPDKIEGQVFNISGRKYETAAQLVQAVVAEYHIKAEIRFVDPDTLDPTENLWPPMVIDFPQWTDSEKLRKLTGWSDQRPLFTEAFHLYRVAFEAARASHDAGVKKWDSLMEFFSSGEKKY